MLSSLALLLFVNQASLKGRVTVDLTEKPVQISPLLFGHNLEGGDAKGIFGPDHSNNSVTGDGFWDPEAKQPTQQGLRALKEAGATLLRYPGGCLGHGYEWKKMVGPLKDRPLHPFGLMEFMALCEKAEVEPLMTLPDYAASPQDVEDLAQFLLAPATPGNPWAQKRAEWGHPAPYKVKRFELGNETDHGNHDLTPRKLWSADDYSAWALDCFRRIKKVSPSAAVGPHLGTSFPNVDDPWNDVVLKRLGKEADFLVIHPYGIAVFNPPKPEDLEVSRLMEACMAQGEQYEAALRKYKSRIKARTGRDIPLYATEYNAAFVQEKPKPLRYSLGGALFASDLLRIMMNPDSGVKAANYWQILNGYWGMVEERLPDRPRSQAALPLFKLWKERFGPLWIPTKSQGPTAEFQPVSGANTRAAYGSALVATETEKGPNLFRTSQLTAEPGVTLLADSTARLEFRNHSGELHLPLALTPGRPGSAYRVSFQARSGSFDGQPLKGLKLGLSMIDGRGWAEVQSGIAMEGVEAAQQWRSYTALFEPHPDCPSVAAAWRLIPQESSVSGWMEVRGISIKPVDLPHFPAYQLLTSAASLSQDGRTLSVMLFNKSLTSPMEVKVMVGGRAVSAKRWTVSGPSADSMNLTKEEVKLSHDGGPVPINSGSATLLLEPCSMTSLQVVLSQRL